MYDLNTVYKTVGGIQLRMDITLPADRQRYPCVVFFHGGGWITGQKEDVRRFPWIMDPLLQAGVAVASVEYRLAQKNGGEFPASVEDCIQALTYLDTLPQIDRDRKAVWGISAGGYMALMCVLYQDVCGIHTPITAVLDLCAPTSLLSPMPEQTQHFVRTFLTGAQDKTFDPLRLLPGASIKPPIMIVHGSADECVPADQSRQLYIQAIRNGFYAEYIEVENAGHTFQAVSGRIYPPMQDLYKHMSNFLIENI